MEFLASPRTSLSSRLSALGVWVCVWVCTPLIIWLPCCLRPLLSTANHSERGLIKQISAIPHPSKHPNLIFGDKELLTGHTSVHVRKVQFAAFFRSCSAKQGRLCCWRCHALTLLMIHGRFPVSPDQPIPPSDY